MTVQSRQCTGGGPTVRGLLLDFYGTVVEEDDDVITRICVRAAASTPRPVAPDDVRNAWGRAFFAGMTDPAFRPQRTIAVESLAAALAETGCVADAEVLCAEQIAYWRIAPLRPGSRAALSELDELGIPVCVVSNIDRAELSAVIELHGLAFTAVVTSEDVGAYKPARAIFERGLAKLGLEANDVVHVGDSLTSDVEGARRAGIRPIWVNRRRRLLPDGLADVPVIDTLADLPAHLT